MKIFSVLLIIIVTNIAFAELLQPHPNLKAEEVILIQLSALKKNNSPYKNAGIEQTWEFSHPSNRIFTGPLENFTKMMYSSSYSMMLNHKNHKIIEIKNMDNTIFFSVELEDQVGNRYGFQWVVTKVIQEGKYKNCWMTISVSQPISLAKSA